MHQWYVTEHQVQYAILITQPEAHLSVCLQVVCSEDTLLALNKAKAEGSSTWRVSSTVFGHIASDQVLTPLGHFATAQATQDYPAVHAGKFVQQELEAIKLKQR